MWLSWPVCNNSLCSTIWWGEQWIWWIPLDLRNSRTNWGPLSVTSYAAKRFMTGGCGGHFWLLLANLWICSPRMDHHNQCVAAAMVYPATSVGAMMLLPFTAHCSSVCRGLATTSTIGQQLSSVLLLGGRDVTPPGFGLLAFSLVSPKQTLDNSCFWLLGCLAILRMMLNNGSRLVAVWSHSVGTGNACNRPIRCEDPWGLTGSSKRDKASAFACWLGKFNGIDVCCQCETPPLDSSSSHCGNALLHSQWLVVMHSPAPSVIHRGTVNTLHHEWKAYWNSLTYFLPGWYPVFLQALQYQLNIASSFRPVMRISSR
jgi:hypothetical protein